MTTPNPATRSVGSLFSPSDWPATAKDWIPLIAIGAFIGIDIAIFSVAIGALLFSGPLAGGMGLAVTASILSTLVSSVVLALFSQIRCNIGHVQDIGVAVLAQALAVTVASQALPEQVRIATALVIVALATLASALLLWGTGRLGWGGIARYFPQSVLAGFLAGTGWLMAAGGLSVATGIAIAELFRPDRWSSQIALNAVPAVALGVAVFLTLRRVAWKGTLITFMVAAIAGFHLLLWLSGIPLSEARAAGWLSGVSAASTAIPNLFHLSGQVDWGLVGHSLPAIATVAFLTLIGTLLNTSALNAISTQDSDADRELRLTGLINLSLAAVAGPPAHSGITSSLMVLRAGVSQRGAGLVMAAIILFSLFNVGALVSILPVFVTAGLIIFLGLDFLHDWLIRTQRSYSRAEWATVVIILGIVILAGFAQAIVAGLFISSLIFAWNYAAIPVLRRTGSLRDRSSTLARAPSEAAWLRDHGDSVEVIELQGFMFFGTADRLYDHVRRRMTDAARAPLSHLIVDFQNVVGLDAAAAAQLGRIATASVQHHVTLIFAGYPKNVLATLTRAAPALLSGGAAMSLPSLDEALEMAEDALLARAPASARPTTSMLQRLAPDPDDLPHLERLFAALPTERHVRGSVIMPAGAQADSLVFLEKGRVVIRAPSRNGEGARLRAMSSGAILGDIGLALNARRSADVIAETEVELRRLPLAEIKRIEAEDPPLSHALHRLQLRSLAEKIVFDERHATKTMPTIRVPLADHLQSDSD